MPESHPDHPTGSTLDSAALDPAAPDAAVPDPAAPDAAVPDPAATADEPPVARRRTGVLIPLILGGIIIVLGAAYLVDWLVTKDDIAVGTTIGGVDVGGVSPAAAVARLEQDLAPSLAKPLTLTAHGEPVTIDPAAAGLTAQLEQSVAAVGTRSANPVSRLAALFGADTARPVQVQVDQAALTGQISNLAASSDAVAVEGSVTLAGTKVVVVEPVTGQHLDVPASVSLISAAWSSGEPNSVNGLPLPGTAEPVRASADKVQAAAAEAAALLSGPLTVQAGATPITVPVDVIAAAVTIAPDSADGFSVTVDEAAVRANFQAAAEESQTKPVDASVSIVNDAPTVNPGIDGKTINWPATTAVLGAALRAPDHVLTVAYTTTPPTLTTASVQALGIKEVIGEFTTGGFATDSGQNVKRTAEQVNGALILPGTTFSLNGYTGPRGYDQGYVDAGIIENGVAARGVGGGISQFATTLFNASYFAGMDDIEHKTHSYYISRYPAGREATVFEAADGSSVIDVKFKNSYPTAALIQTIWTPSDITVRIWGTKSVNVDSIAGDRYGYTSAPTKTIPYGQTCKATNGTEGFSIDVTRVITDLSGKEISRVTKTTAYNGQQHTICAPKPADPVTPPATPPPATPGG